MRLDHKTREIIKKEVADQIGTDAVVRLFRSRVEDTQKGGDIDLLIDPLKPVTGRVQAECRLSAILFIKLGGRKVDVLIRNPGSSFRPVYEQALENGVVL